MRYHVRVGRGAGDNALGLDWLRLIGGYNVRLVFGPLGCFYLAWWRER